MHNTRLRGIRLLVGKRRTSEAKIGGIQPPPQALCFSHGRGERETRVTGDEPQGTMRRVYGGRRSVLPVVSFPPSFARTFSSKKRDVWVRDREGRGEAVTFSLHFARHRLRAHARTLPLGSAFEQGNVCIGQLNWIVAGLLTEGRSAASKERLEAALPVSPLLGSPITSCSPFFLKTKPGSTEHKVSFQDPWCKYNTLVCGNPGTNASAPSVNRSLLSSEK